MYWCNNKYSGVNNCCQNQNNSYQNYRPRRNTQTLNGEVNNYVEHFTENGKFLK